MRILPVLFLATVAGCGQQLASDSKGSKDATPVALDDDAESDDARPRKKKKSVKPDKTPRKPAGEDVAAASPPPAPAEEPAASAEPALPASTLAWDGETITGTATLNLLPTE
jgi:hypothetical protein